MFRKMLLFSIISVWVVTLVACGNAEEGQGGGDVKSTAATSASGNKPVELVVFSNWAETAYDFDDVFVKPVQAKYPNISLKIVTSQETKLADLVAAGQSPDILVASVLNLNEARNLGLLTDLTPLIKKYQFDLTRIEPAILEEVKQYSKKNEVYGIPYTANFTATYYNKNIFDKFGVPYPKDGLTWDDALELARKLTKTSDGVQYHGLDPEKITRVASPLGVGFVDPDTNKAIIQPWKTAYELYQQIISIPGNVITPDLKFNKNNFIKEQTVAMLSATNILKDFEQAKDLDWDMTTYPQYSDHKGTFGVAGARALVITPNAKDKDAAFQVISTVLTDTVQEEASRLGTMSPLKSLDVQKTFGSKLPYLNGKNIPAIYQLKPSWRKISDYDDLATDIVNQHFKDITQGKDINTIIRETEEDINQSVAAELAK